MKDRQQTVDVAPSSVSTQLFYNWANHCFQAHRRKVEGFGWSWPFPEWFTIIKCHDGDLWLHNKLLQNLGCLKQQIFVISRLKWVRNPRILAQISVSGPLTRLPLRCLSGLWSHLKVPLRENLLPNPLTRQASSPGHISFHVGVSTELFTASQLDSPREEVGVGREREVEREGERERTNTGQKPEAFCNLTLECQSVTRNTSLDPAYNEGQGLHMYLRHLYFSLQ